jgi:hypothetical protein
MHTLVGSPLIAAAVAGFLRLVVRRTRFTFLLVEAWLGVVIGHIGFDLVSGSDIRVLAPVSLDRFGSHLLTMGDLFATLLLLVGTLFTFWRRRAAAIATLAALVVLLGAKATSQRMATDTYTTALVARGERHVRPARRPEAISGSLFGWNFYDRYGDQVRAWRVDARSRLTTLEFVRTVPSETPAIAATRELSVVRNFLALAELPFPRVRQDGAGQAVLWSDVRSCDRTDCDLSFGLVPMLQLIQIGTYRQTREIGK